MIFADDDYRPVETSVELDVSESQCFPIAVFTAVAQGCGNRIPEDTTSTTVPSKIDGEAPKGVGCSLGLLSMTVLRGRGLTDSSLSGLL